MIRLLPLIFIGLILIILVVQFIFPFFYKKARTREEEIKKEIKEVEDKLSK